MKADILGLGPTLKHYRKQTNVSFGVNDITRAVNTDYVVCLDKPIKFDEDRLSYILSTQCHGFFSQHVQEYGHLLNFKEINLTNERGLYYNEPKKVLKSNNSPFVACLIAIKMGYWHLTLYGVDFTNHRNLHKDSKDNWFKLHEDFRWLKRALEEKGGSLQIISKESSLSEYLDVANPKL